MNPLDQNPIEDHSDSVSPRLTPPAGGEIPAGFRAPRRRSPGRPAALATALLVILLAALATPLAALHPNHPVGVDPERAFFSGSEGLDRVDLFSGSLLVTIPIGPFALINTSNVWHYRVDPNTGELLARPNWEDTAGIGWHLGWGELYHKDHPFNQTGEWLYVDETNSRHTLYRKLHRDDDDDGDENNRVYYSRDGSYLRMRLTADNCHAYIESKDGTTRRLTGSCGPLTTYRLSKVWSPFASEADPDLTITYTADPAHPKGEEDTLRIVTNRYGLTHKVHLSDLMNNDPGDPVHWMRRIVTKVDLEGFDGQRSVYTFTYQQFNLDRSCKSDAGGRIAVPHLERVDLPDGTSFSMVEGDDFLYENLCRWIDGHQVEDLPGVLTGLNLPTGGKLRWSYQLYDPPSDDSEPNPFDDGAGIKTRSIHPAGAPATPGNALGTWTFRSTVIPPMDTGIPGESTHPEMHLELVYPTGDCTKHYFDAIYWVDPVNSSGTPWGWERGLPFVYSEEVADRFLSSEVFTGSTGKGSCDPATKVRTTYLRFRHDTTPGSGSDPQSVWINTNRQLQASRTVFHDDGDGYVDTEYGDFDGLGNFRVMSQTGNLWGMQERQTTTGYNRSNGTYPGSYTALQVTEPWILGVYDSVEVSEPGAVGLQTAKTEYAFEDATGFLTCSRVLASGTARGTNDLLTVNLRDDLGLVTDVKKYGGDTQPISTGGSACGTVPSQPTYWAHHDYDPLSGALERSRPKTPTGADGPFLVYDADIEARTGMVIRERDSAGFETEYEYDQAGRVVVVTPQQGAVTVHDYLNPTATEPARVKTTLQTQGILATILAESEVVLDDFGRTRKERRRLPGGVWTERETLYNARGWVESVSEWGDLAKRTRFLAFDPFGRATVVRPPEGAVHDVLRDYLGQRSLQEIKKIALPGGEAPVIKTYLYDGFGRLVRVWERSDPGGGPVSTTYSYDVGGRLTEVRTGDPKTGEQVRSFDFDGRGFLLSETHPEKGASGNGTVLYGDYDAGGNLHGLVDGPIDLIFTYDDLGRAKWTLDHADGDRPVTQRIWDSAPGFGLGKLSRIRRFNYLDLPWNAAGEETVIVDQIFGYGGLGGRADVKTTEVLWSEDDVRMHQTYTYDDLGNVLQMSYPACELPKTCAGGGVGTGPTVSYAYDQGMLTGMPGWVDQITYHSSGLWNQTHRANGVVDHQDKDDDYSRRRKRIYTSGAIGWNWDSGLMLYDGAGNLKAQGTHQFTYDHVSRVIGTSYEGGGLVQDFTYDRFGNITGATGEYVSSFRAPAVDSATNRLTNATYDAAGNMITAPPFLPTAPNTYAPDGRLIGQAYLLYLLDGFGERTATIVRDQETPAGLFYLRDLNHRLLSDLHMNSDGSWERHLDYRHAGDRALGRTSPGFGGDRHYHLDHLGSVRLTTTEEGHTGTGNDFWAYGERMGEGSTADFLLWAGPHERDFIMDTDYMHARWYWWKLARFHSPDPILGSPEEPQSWNRYAYVMGNPVNATDPTGMFSHLDPGEVDGVGDPNPAPSFWGAIGLGGTSGGVMYLGPGNSLFRQTTTSGEFTYTLNGEPMGLNGYTDVSLTCLAGACRGDRYGVWVGIGSGGGRGGGSRGGGPRAFGAGRGGSDPNLEILRLVGKNSHGIDVLGKGLELITTTAIGGQLTKGLLRGVQYGGTAEAIGAQTLLRQGAYRGMYGVADWGLDMQAGFVLRLAFRNPRTVTVLPGGFWTGVESQALGLLRFGF